MNFDGFIAIDWSGDKNTYQKGIKVALLEKKSKSPKIVLPPNSLKYWSRSYNRFSNKKVSKKSI